MPAKQRCPSCRRRTMIERRGRAGGVLLDWCRRCQGIWFDKAELGTLLDRETRRVGPILGGEEAEDADAAHARCPRDGRRMFHVPSTRNTEVVLDYCTVCQGIWLDGGEFERIKRAQPGVRLGDLV